MSKYIKISSLTREWEPAYTKLPAESVPDEEGIDLLIEGMVEKNFFVAKVGTVVRVRSLKDVEITIVEREDGVVTNESLCFV